MRYLEPYISENLGKKEMVLVGGPRHVGKTTMAQSIITGRYPGGRYLSWERDDHRQDIFDQKWSRDNRLLVFDELHKYPHWLSWLRDIHNNPQEPHSILVAGSARLDHYVKSGGSLLRNYQCWRLHPFTLDEFPEGFTPRDAFTRMMNVGGFPEPFLDGDEQAARQWRRERFDRVLREDVRDLESARNIQLLSLFLDQLRRRVGRLLNLADLAREVQISPNTAKSWLEILERMYLVFVVRPYTSSLPRAILKQPKVYFFDNADVIGNEGARFENLVASSLLKRIHILEDRTRHRFELRFVRDKEGREVDFAIVREDRLVELVEVKYGDNRLARPLQYFAKRLNPIRATQIVAHLKHPYDKNKLRVIDPLSYFGSFFPPESR